MRVEVGRYKKERDDLSAQVGRLEELLAAAQLEAARAKELELERDQLLARIKDDGVLNAFVVYFRLHLDDDDVFDTGPANPKLVAWDQAPPRP